MLIQCTNALLSKINVEKPRETAFDDSESLFAWHGNIVTFGRKKAIVLINNKTRYPIVIFRPKSKDFKRLDKLIKEAISTSFHMQGIRKDIINKYLETAGKIEYSKTAGRSMVSKMNTNIREIGYFTEYLDDDSLIQKYISYMAGNLIVNDPMNQWGSINEYLISCLTEYFNEMNILDIKLYQLKINIQLDGHNVWRRVLVPSTYSFLYLHNVIQTVFDWQNYHLHFFKAGKDRFEEKFIVMDDDDQQEWPAQENNEILKERFTPLEDIFSEYDFVEYVYDFGDSWVHNIIFEAVVNSNEFKVSYIEGEGERPPEDVGGIGGYMEYLRIMEDESDPEYEEMREWAESQRERNMTAEEINKRLEKVVHRNFSQNI